jgi:hypothetical protein
MALTRVGMTAASAALVGAGLVATSVVIAAWAALAAYDIVAARYWADEIVAELRIAPGYAELAAADAQAIAVAAAGLALAGLAFLYAGWSATRAAPGPVTIQVPATPHPAANDGFARGMVENPRVDADVRIPAAADNASSEIEKLSGITLSEQQREALAKFSPEQRERVAKIAGVLGKFTHE